MGRLREIKILQHKRLIKTIKRKLKRFLKKYQMFRVEIFHKLINQGVGTRMSWVENLKKKKKMPGEGRPDLRACI